MSEKRSSSWRLGVLALALCSGDGRPHSESLRDKNSNPVDLQLSPRTPDETLEGEINTWAEVQEILTTKREEHLATEFPEFDPEIETVGQMNAAIAIKECVEKESRGQCSYWHVNPPQLNCTVGDDEKLMVSWQLYTHNDALKLSLKYGTWLADEVPVEDQILTNDPEDFPAEAARACVSVSNLMNTVWYESANDDEYIGLGDSPNSVRGVEWVMRSVNEVFDELYSLHGDLVVQDGTNIVIETGDQVSIRYIATGNWYFPVKYYPVMVKYDEFGEVISFYRSPAMYDENVIHNVRTHLQ